MLLLLFFPNMFFQWIFLHLQDAPEAGYPVRNERLLSLRSFPCVSLQLASQGTRRMQRSQTWKKAVTVWREAPQCDGLADEGQRNAPPVSWALQVQDWGRFLKCSKNLQQIPSEVFPFSWYKMWLLWNLWFSEFYTHTHIIMNSSVYQGIIQFHWSAILPSS